MATARRRISSIECDICQDRYEQPKILDCMHSFCEKCLEKYYTSRYKGKTTIPCPVCRQNMVLPENRIQGLVTNFQLMGIVEEVSLQEKMGCSVKNTIEEDESECQKHTGEVNWFYCETCRELICRVCTVVDHCKPTHDYIDAEEASLKYKQSLKDKFPDFDKNIKQLEHATAASSQAKQKFTQNVTQTVKAVQEKADKMRAEITTQETKMIEEIKGLQQDRNRVYDEHQNTLTTMLQGKQHSQKTAQDVVNTASHRDMLYMYPNLSRNLETLKSENPPQIDPGLSHPRFTPGQRIGDINLGDLEVEVGKWESCGKIGKLGRGPGEFNGAQGITAAQPGDIAVLDYGNNRVVICSNEGEHKGTIRLTGPRAVAAIQNRLITLEIGSKYVKVFDLKDNTLDFQFPTVPKDQFDNTQVNLWSLAVRDNGTIIVGDVKRLVWTEHRPTDGKILHTIPVQTPPHYLTVDDDTDRVVVSGFDKKKVDVADSKGATLSTIIPTICGQPVLCQGVCCDKSGIYLAVIPTDLGAGHIHNYDPNGGFLACLAQGLYCPRGITFTSDGQLAVADDSSLKMYRKV